MRKKLSEMSPPELTRTRMVSTIAFTLLFIAIQIIFNKGTRIIPNIAGGIVAGVLWFLFWHRLTILLEKKFIKRKL